MVSERDENLKIEARITDAAEIEQTYYRFTFRKLSFILITIALLIGLALISLSVGAAHLGIDEVFKALIARILPFSGVESGQLADNVVWHLRLPRIVIGIVAGMGFGIAGTAMQGVMRNPLVSPYTTGVSSAAAFGASLAIIVGVGIGKGHYLIIGNAFLFAMAATFIVYGIARIRHVTSETLVLAGIAVMYLTSAATSFLHYGATEEELQTVVHWLFGSLTGVGWTEILIISTVLFICLGLLLKYSWDLNAMAGGDETAVSLGINTARVRIICMILASLITATIIGFTGIIGFIGLVAPHITRMVIGTDHRFLLPYSCVIGALLLLGADTAARTVLQPLEIPVGIMTAFVGVPFFLYLMLTRRRQYWG
jgi:iron complex transport system permease protein